MVWSVEFYLELNEVSNAYDTLLCLPNNIRLMLPIFFLNKKFI